VQISKSKKKSDLFELGMKNETLETLVKTSDKRQLLSAHIDSMTIDKNITFDY
jgi:hypothetical protein